MRDLRVATAVAAAVLSLSIAGCSKPDSVGLTQVSRPPAPAAPRLAMGEAEKLRRLDIMLIVTALRCRSTGDDFTSDYRRFASQQMAPLNQAAAELRGQLAVRHGARGGKLAFDRISTGMANAYGGGHPWLGCRELKLVVRNLAKVEGRATLEEAADQLLSRKGSAHLAYGKR